MTPKKDRIPIEEGQHYEHKRGQIYTVEYMNGDIALLYDGSNYRLERQQYFKKEVDSGMYELRPDLEITNSETEIPLEDIEWVGEKAAESLRRAGITTPREFEYLTDEKISELEAVGDRSIENIRKWINNNTTQTVEI